MANFYFNIAQPKKAQQQPVYLWITFDRAHRRKINTQVYVLPGQFDFALQQVVGHSRSGSLNLQLSLVKKKWLEVEAACIMAGEKFSWEYLNQIAPVRQLQPKQRENEANANPDFLVYMLKSISVSSELAESTRRNQYRTQRRLCRYYPTLFFKDINYSLLQDFDRKCLIDGLTRNTISKFHKDIKKYLHKAELEGVYTYPVGQHPYANFKVPRIKGNRSYLTSDELKGIEGLPISGALGVVRDMFLFMCYTGLRISDFCRIEKSMLAADGSLILTPQKTKESSCAEVRLPLKQLFNGRPWEIWERYHFDFPNKGTGFSLRFNQLLKELAIAAGINKRLSAHVGRHTFLTQIANRTGNVFTVMLLGGIKKVDTAQVYIHLSTQEHALDNVNWG